MTTELKQTSDADVLYGSAESIVSTYKASLTDSMDLLRDSTPAREDGSAGMSDVERQQLLSETSQFFHGAGIKAELASRLHRQVVQHLKSPPDDATFEKWQVDSRRQLRQKYGDDADRRMRLANDYVASHPTLAKQLLDSGMGSHPDVLLALTERAERLRPRRK